MDYPAIIASSSSCSSIPTSTSPSSHPRPSTSNPTPLPPSSSSGQESAGLSHSVRGTLVHGLTDGDIWRLDIFEGSEYIRQTVTVYPLITIGDDLGYGNVEEEMGEDVETYVWIAREDHLEETEWDFKDFIRDKMWRWAGKESEKEGEYDGEWFFYCVWLDGCLRSVLLMWHFGSLLMKCTN